MMTSQQTLKTQLEAIAKSGKANLPLRCVIAQGRVLSFESAEDYLDFLFCLYRKEPVFLRDGNNTLRLSMRDDIPVTVKHFNISYLGHWDAWSCLGNKSARFAYGASRGGMGHPLAAEIVEGEALSPVSEKMEASK